MDGFNEETCVELLQPAQQRLPFVFNSPHSGRSYPRQFLESSHLDTLQIRRSEDAFVDELFMSVVALGAPLVRALFPRAYLDVNREPYELDPKMFRGRLPPFANIRSVRVAGGLGTIARVVGERQDIYSGPLDVTEGLERIETIYKPYHRTLRRLLAETHIEFGHAVLIDCHSMPSSVRGHDSLSRPDFILGDRYGTSCSADISEAAADILTGLGYSIVHNRPYAGGFITEHYGRPAKGLHALQVEINRALYMDERLHCPHEGFDRVAADMATFAHHLTSIPDHGLPAPAIAAE
ncbi:N-formylglutamate amidohydrolase [Breoghania sp.]|uniref:N-formylglutamate amidohydrolase n=1 Tax=Breoghania sp. TaxID=2065378 RepID=UPI00262CE962|nr:N-formylglutamate amidohydrolase [Breoghania sp.]MDJ0932456.1 N-formylglutamate amidohydrolase [Breoghania sp.]